MTSASATRTADFYPRPPRGGRPSPNRGPSEANDQFLSTPSARRATSRRAIRSLMGAYFYPRPPRGGRQSCPHSRLQRLGISIHALREEGDLHPGDVDWPPVISIHALREEGDISSSAVFSAMGVFLSTPSARRATATATSLGYSVEISIHALREEGDCTAQMIDPELVQFLSTPSARRATSSPASSALGLRNFYPRPPRGGRLDSVYVLLSRCIFLSTPSARRATNAV